MPSLGSGDVTAVLRPTVFDRPTPEAVELYFRAGKIKGRRFRIHRL